jgi:UDP-N-acetylglucosamine transferase subunit ALG13
VILVTVGTHTQPFHRAIDLLIDMGPTEALVIQHGATPPRPDELPARWVEFLEADVMNELMREARGVISHAGVGCTIMSLRAGKKPVLIPRLYRLGEHVDDHQLQLADRFGQRELAYVCHEGEPLGPVVARAMAEPRYEMNGIGDALGQAVVQAAFEAPRARRRLLRR